MGTSRADVEQTLRSYLTRISKGTDVELTDATPLYADGIGLDSLETAELSAVLEDELGTDPFSAGEMPQTVGELVAFYESVASDA